MPDDLHAQLTRFYDFINEPWRGMGDPEPMDVRDYRYELYRKWEPLCLDILAALKSRPLESVNADLLEALKASVRSMKDAVEKLNRGLPTASAIRVLATRSKANEAAISLAEKSQ